MPVYDPESYNVIMLLQNEEQNQLEKIVRLKDSTGRIVSEYKAFPEALVGSACLKRTFVYDKFEDVTAETVATAEWTQALESVVNPTAVVMLSINLSQLIVADGAPAGSKIADLSTLGGNNPYTYSIIADPSDKFQILGDQLLLKDVSDIVDVSYDVTIQSTDLSGSTLTESFTLPIEDQTPTDITLSSSVIFDGATTGEIVGTLSADGTHLPVTFSISSDPSNKFTITDNNKLTMDGTADIADVSYSVTVKAIDCLLGTFEKVFVVTVEDVSVQLSSLQVIHDSVAGTKVADITGGSANEPVTYSIVADPSSKFDITDLNVLILSDTANIQDTPYSVTIRGTDALLNTHDEVFSIKVVSREDFLGSDTQYFEGDVDADIKGTAIMWEDAGNTLVPVSAANPLPVNATVSGASPPGDVTIYNVLVGTANTEFSQALPASTRAVKVQVRDPGIAANLQYAFTVGESGTDYFTVKPGNKEEINSVDFTGTTIYFQVSKANVTVEILALHN